MAGRTKIKDRVQKQHGRPFGEVLREYAGRPLTPEQIAGELGCSVTTLLGIPGIRVVRRVVIDECNAADRDLQEDIRAITNPM